MTLQEKYSSVLNLGEELEIQNGDVFEEDGKLIQKSYQDAVSARMANLRKVVESTGS